MLQSVQFRDCGRIAYAEAWALQESLMAAAISLKLAADRDINPHDVPTTHHLLFCEHPHVYTLGKNGNAEHLLASPDFLEAIGATYFRINRGGDITYHGPGQITGYPIFDLEKFKPDIHLYLRNMEEAIIQYLATRGLVAGRIAGETGVWLHIDSPYPKKICAIGVRLSRWITLHGFAFNVNTDLSYFQHIVPCGIADKGVTSLAAELGETQDFEAVKRDVLAHFAAQFGFSVAD